MRKSSKANRRYMRNAYRRTFGMNKRLIRWYMRRGNKMPMPDPAKYPGIFGEDPATHPKNKYQWRMQMKGG